MQGYTYKNRNGIFGVLLTSCLSLSMYPEQALSGGSDTTQSTPTTDTTIVSPLVQNAASLSVTPTTLVQSGAGNFANINSNTGGLAYPNCGGTCFFGIVRASSSNNFNSGNSLNSGQVEALVGFVQSFGTSDQVIAEANRNLVAIQKTKSEIEINIDLALKLSDAIESGKEERANIIAILLAPRLGKAPLQLLAEVRAKPQPKDLKPLAEVQPKPQSNTLKTPAKSQSKAQPKKFKTPAKISSKPHLKTLKNKK